MLLTSNGKDSRKGIEKGGAVLLTSNGRESRKGIEKGGAILLTSNVIGLVIACHGVDTIKLSQVKISTSEVIILGSEISSHTCVFFLKFLMNLSLVAFPK